jgi:hypothetical protein
LLFIVDDFNLLISNRSVSLYEWDPGICVRPFQG